MNRLFLAFAFTIGFSNLQAQSPIKLEVRNLSNNLNAAWTEVHEGRATNLTGYFWTDTDTSGLIRNRTEARITNQSTKSIVLDSPYSVTLSPGSSYSFPGTASFNYCNQFSHTRSDFCIPPYSLPVQSFFKMTYQYADSSSEENPNSRPYFNITLSRDMENTIYPATTLGFSARQLSERIFNSEGQWIFVDDTRVIKIGDRTGTSIPFEESLRLQDSEDQIFVADFLGLGRSQILNINTNGEINIFDKLNGAYRKVRSIPSHFTEDQGWMNPNLRKQVLSGDVNGDGRSDLVFFRLSGRMEIFLGDRDQGLVYSGSTMTSLSEANGWFRAAGQRALGDIDGDGSQELLALDDFGNLKFYRFTGNSFVYVSSSFTGLAFNNIIENLYFYSGDRVQREFRILGTIKISGGLYILISKVRSLSLYSNDIFSGSTEGVFVLKYNSRDRSFEHRSQGFIQQAGRLSGPGGHESIRIISQDGESKAYVTDIHNSLFSVAAPIQFKQNSRPTVLFPLYGERIN